MCKGQFELLAAGIAQIRPETSDRPVEERALRAQITVDEHLRDGDVTPPERQQLRFLIAEILRMNAHAVPTH